MEEAICILKVDLQATFQQLTYRIPAHLPRIKKVQTNALIQRIVPKISNLTFIAEVNGTSRERIKE